MKEDISLTHLCNTIKVMSEAGSRTVVPNGWELGKEGRCKDVGQRILFREVTSSKDLLTGPEKFRRQELPAVSRMSDKGPGSWAICSLPECVTRKLEPRKSNQNPEEHWDKGGGITAGSCTHWSRAPPRALEFDLLKLQHVELYCLDTISKDISCWPKATL